MFLSNSVAKSGNFVARFLWPARDALCGCLPKKKLPPNCINCYYYARTAIKWSSLQTCNIRTEKKTKLFFPIDNWNLGYFSRANSKRKSKRNFAHSHTTYTHTLLTGSFFLNFFGFLLLNSVFFRFNTWATLKYGFTWWPYIFGFVFD